MLLRVVKWTTVHRKAQCPIGLQKYLALFYRQRKYDTRLL